MDLVPWNSKRLTSSMRPFFGDEISNLRNEMNSMMNNFLTNRDVSMPLSLTTSWYPSIDLQEKDDKYLLDADVPGFRESDLDIDFHNNILTIKGEIKTEKKSKESDYVCVERSHGSFRRDIYLDEEVNKDTVKADLKDGVLHIEMPKKEKSSSNHRKITIKH